MRYQIEWTTPAGALVAIEPGPGEVAAVAARLAAAYNEPHNARLLGHTAEMTPEEVEEHYRGLGSASASSPRAPRGLA